jgi:hypothetical protein
MLLGNLGSVPEYGSENVPGEYYSVQCGGDPHYPTPAARCSSILARPVS